MTGIIHDIAARKTLAELYPPEDGGPEITYELLVDRSNILDLIIAQARTVKPAVITIIDGNVGMLNPDNLPISVRDYDTAEWASLEELGAFGESACEDDDGDWYIERGNQ